MIEFAAPEFLLLAIPVWFAFYRWGRLPVQTAWLLAAPLWGVFLSWPLPAHGESGEVFDAIRLVQRYGVLLLPVPLWLGLRNWGRGAGATNWLRLGLAAVLLFCLAGPRWNVGGTGVDVIVLADRSRSVEDARSADGTNARFDETILELIDTLQKSRREGDRVAVISVGGGAKIEKLLTETQTVSNFQQPINPHGSDLDQALQKALGIVDPNRPARILVLSDGEYTGPSPLAAARRAREAGVPVDVRVFDTRLSGDVAVRSLSLPRQATANEPFQFSATIQSDGEVGAVVRLTRESVEDGKTVRRKLAELSYRLRAGRNDVRFGDVLASGGTHRYIVEVDVEGDPRPQNNRWEAEIFVDAGPRLLLLVKGENAREGRLAKLLKRRQSGIPTDVLVAKRQPLTKLQLDRYRAVILEDVPADHLGFLKMARLEKFVTDQGGGLMLTGGENSFGSGGYFKSPIDPILPVSMELREEHRKLRAAIAVVLDRSGSMRQGVAGGRTKMDLANLGAEECARLLSAQDMLSVIAVDTAAHVVQELASVDNKDAVVSRIRSIQSQGGGIFVDVALDAAQKELDRAGGYQTRHVILFSDAKDTEISPGNALGGSPPERAVIEKVRAMKSKGMSVSVIGLGSERDQHAALLTAIAEAGGGNVMFTEDARDLPRLFTQDAMKVARNTFLRKGDEHPEGFPGKRLPGPFLIGELGRGRFPNVHGYNLTYKRKRAQAAVVSADEYAAPWSAFWHRGLGRVAAVTFDVGGPYAGPFAEWRDRSSFLLTHARWLLGGDDPRGMFVDVERQGQDAVVTVEFDPRRGTGSPGDGFPTRPERLENPSPESVLRLKVIPPGPEAEEARQPEFVWVDRNVLQARFRLDRLGIYRTRISAGRNQSLRGPSISLPYSPEFFPRTGLPSGRKTLTEIAEISGGTERTDVLEVLDRGNLPRLPRMVSMLPVLCAVLIALLLVEIAGRRLALWERWQAGWTRSRQTVDDVEIAVARKRRWWQDWRRRRTARSRKSAADETSAAESDTGDARQTSAPAPSITSLLEQAKQQARRRRRE